MGLAAAASLEENLVEANKHADSLARKLEQSEKARKKAESDAAAIEDLRQRLHDAETSLSDNMAEQAAREKEILSRLQSQSRRFVRKTHQDFDLECPEGDQLLDELSLLEFHGEEAREGLAEARAGLSRLFPYFFPKKEEPKIFTTLAKCFNSQEDLGLKLRQEGLKIGVEGTIALVADSQQDVDWAKVGDIKEMEMKKWQSLIKALKPNSKPILAFLGCKQTPAPSRRSSRPPCLSFLIFDNYTSTPRPSDVFPASSHSKKTPVDNEFVEDSSSKGSAQDLEELRQQLQYMKKKTLIIMDQSRKSSEKEKAALQQAQEAIAAKEAAVSEAAKATTRENFMLELMTEASLDMTDQTQIATAVTVSSGDDGGDDGGDDDDGDGDDVQLDDGDDGVDFPSGGNFPVPPPESSFLSGVLRPAEAAVTLRGTLCGLGFRDEGFREEKEAKGVVGPPNHMAVRPGHGPRRLGCGPTLVLWPPSGFLRHLEK
ncbi:hypothetical protein QYE76_000348 [Lolium multiflorum]|uniref:Uncharacterized protein n=1 Tax=Lolium multiflorum TaxID=4521 RepID=A0AAD8RIZ3_LOLMU|nr:hypothetical protein QYE76_000348 [Lolium multiflorum]